MVSIGAVLCVELAAGTVAGDTPVMPIVFLGIVRLMEIALLVVTALVWGNGWSSLGLARASAVHGLVRGLLWSAAFGVTALIAHLILYAVGINGMTLIHTYLPRSGIHITLWFLVGGLVGPAAEEIFFRGILYGFFRRWGVFVALTVSTLVFVLVHPGFPRIPVTHVVGGVVFAMAYEIEGTLMAPLTIHVLGNTAIFMLSLFSP
jgi:hypothetical protein